MGRTLQLALLLFACVCASVLGAWVCARWDEKHPVSYQSSRTTARKLSPEAAEYLGNPAFNAGFGPERANGFSTEIRRSIACTVVECRRWHDHDDLLGYTHSQSEHQFGFPFRSMQRTERSWSDPAAYPEFASWRVPGPRGGWPIAPAPEQQDWRQPAYARPAHVYPITPLWTGLLLNAFLYAFAAMAALRGPRAVRGWIRGRRNLCINCAYPRGASPVCSECGQLL